MHLPLRVKLPAIVLVFAALPALLVGVSVSFTSRQAIREASSLMIAESEQAVLKLGSELIEHISENMQKDGGALIVSGTQEVVNNLSNELATLGASAVEKAATQITALAETSINELSKGLIQEARTPLNDLIAEINTQNEAMAMRMLEDNTSIRANLIIDKLATGAEITTDLPSDGGAVILDTNGTITARYGAVPADNDYDLQSEVGFTPDKSFLWVAKPYQNGHLVLFAPTKTVLTEVSAIQNNARRTLLLTLSNLNRTAITLNSQITAQFQEPVTQLSGEVKEQIGERSAGITSDISSSLQSQINTVVASSVDQFAPLARQQALSQSAAMQQRSAGILDSSQGKIIKFTTVTLFISLICAAVISILFAKGLVRRITSLLSMAKEVAQGNLSVQVVDQNKDELGELAIAFNQVTCNLSGMVSEIKNTVVACQEAIITLDNVSANSNQIAKGIQNAMSAVAVGASDSADQITKSVGEMMQIQGHSEEVGSAVNHAGDLSEQVKLNTIEGRGSLSSLVGELKAVGGQLNTLSISVAGITHKAEAIDDIVSIIGKLAEQTRMVSLNASIEAAKAGMHGHSFAVVAEEVRKLADRVQQAGQQVSELVSDLQESFIQLTKIVDESQEKSMTSSSCINHAEEAFDKIESSVLDISEQIASIQDKAVLLMDNATQATNFINDVAAITQEMSASAEEVTSSTQEQVNHTQKLSEVTDGLEGLIQSLDNSIQKFSL